jgi:hypothetical protein
MKLYLKYLPFVFVSVIFSCKVSEQPAGQSTDTADVEEVKADSVELQDEETHELRIYRGEKTRHFHLIHTKLDVRFDWENQQLNGRANLALRPYFYDQSELVLDAKDFDLHQISLLEGEKQIALKYDYDGKKITISLGRPTPKIKNYSFRSIIPPSPMKGATRQTSLTTKRGFISLTLLERFKENHGRYGRMERQRQHRNGFQQLMPPTRNLRRKS